MPRPSKASGAGGLADQQGDVGIDLGESGTHSGLQRGKTVPSPPRMPGGRGVHCGRSNYFMIETVECGYDVQIRP
jgi:hypothetical protein